MKLTELLCSICIILILITSYGGSICRQYVHLKDEIQWIFIFHNHRLELAGEDSGANVYSYNFKQPFKTAYK